MEAYEFMKTMGERTNRVNQIYSDWAKTRGINYNVLSVLYTTYKNRECSQKYICEQWCLPKQTVSTTCKELISRGIIAQVPNACDKRVNSISLTEKGNEFARPIVEALLEIENRVLTRMGKDEVLQFFRLYHTYVQDIELEFSDSATREKSEK